MVGVADIGDPFPAFQLNAFPDKGSATVLAAKQSTVPEYAPVGARTNIFLFAFCKERLCLFPYLTSHDYWQIILMSELLLWVCETEGLVDLIALALVADQSADVAFISAPYDP